MTYRIPADSPYTLKAFKHLESMSEETLCFEAKLARNGKVVARVGNAGHGGENDLHFETSDEAKAFTAYALALPPDGDLKMDAEYLVTILACALAEEVNLRRESKRFAKACATQTLYRLEGDAAGEWRMTSMVSKASGRKIRRPMTTGEVEKYIAPKGKIVAILNDLLPSDPFAFRAL